jgi:hypothetical protein
MLFPVVSAGPGREKHEQGPEPLSAGVNDVVRHPVDEGDGTVETMFDDPIDRVEIGGDKFAYLFKCHGRPGAMRHGT